MISFVYLDVGGVAEFDFSGTNKWEELKAEIGINPDRFEEFDNYWDGFRDINTTRDVELMKPLLERKFGVKFPPNYSLLVNGFVNRFAVNKSIWPVVKEIKKYSRIGLLTNMYPHMLEEIEKRKLIPDIDWDVVVDSSKISLQKPDKEIFEYAERESGFDRSQILFVDNSYKNIAAARDLGWQTFLYDTLKSETSSQKLLDFFRNNK